MLRTPLRTLTTAIAAATVLVVPLALSGAGSAQAGGASYGKVTFVDDGDTVDVRFDHGGTSRIRYIGVQAMELSYYKKDMSLIRGECWGPEATRMLHKIAIRKRVMVTSRHASSHSGNGRLHRSISVMQNGVWTDTGGMIIDAGLALPDLIPDEYNHNLDYMTRAQQAAANHVGMFGNPAKCGGGQQGAVLSVNINWDAEHNDAQNVNGEWVDIGNNGGSAVDISRWWIRDAAYRGIKAHGYVFPAGTVILPGQRLRLHVGQGGTDATTQHWGLNIPIFANVTNGPKWMGDGAWLFDARGDLRSWQMYPCRYAC
jgi:endonuclease YncB( thermonuclease family)